MEGVDVIGVSIRVVDTADNDERARIVDDFLDKVRDIKVPGVLRVNAGELFITANAVESELEFG